jgi:UDP-glucose 4-epimerase
VVTGGAGYIGSISVRHLLDEGHEVVVLDSLERGHREAVDPRARLVVGDVGDPLAVADAVEACDAVLHCAGLIEVAESMREPGRYFEVNACRPLRMLERMRDRGVDAIVFSSTAAVYGEPEDTPIREDHACRPINPYGASKLTLERMLEWFERAHGLRSIRLRYFNVAGAWSDGSLGEAHDPETHVVPRVLDAMASGRESFEVYGGDYPTLDGTCVRDYIHVWDLARAHRLALERLAGGGEGGVFNLGNGEGFSNLDVVRTCARVSGREVAVKIGPRREGDPAVLLASNDRAREELAWAPEADLEQMVTDAWAWRSEHPHGYA